MAGTGGARDRRDGRRRGMLDRSPEELPSKCREVKMTGGCSCLLWCRVLVSAGGCTRPQRGEKLLHRDVVCDAHARGAQRGCRSGEKAAVTAGYGSGGYSDRSSQCQNDMGCRGQRDGALRLGEVGGLHGRGDRIVHSGWHRSQRMASATADGIGHSGWHRPQRMASTPAMVRGEPR